MNLPGPLRHWKIILLMAAIFVAGAVCGTAIAGGSVGRLLIRVVNFDGWPERTIHQYQRDLKLTKEQVDKIRPLIAQRQPEMLRIRNETIGKFGRVFNELNAEIKPLMTPEQAAKFDAINKKRGERIRRELKLE